MAFLLLWPLKAISQKLAKKKIRPSAEELPKYQQLHVKIYTNNEKKLNKEQNPEEKEACTSSNTS